MAQKCRFPQVIGPWSNCKERAGGYGGSMGYLNNYKGQPSYINTVLDAVTEEGKGSDGGAAAGAAAAGFEVVYAPGSEQVGTKGNASLIAEAMVRQNAFF